MHPGLFDGQRPYPLCGWVFTMTICRNVVVLAGVLLASWIASAHRSAGEELNWLTDLDEAKQVAQAEGKSIFVDFTGSDWCVWCIRLDREVLATEEFAAAADKWVFVKLDFPNDRSNQPAEERARNEELSKEYSVSGFPTVLLLDDQGRPFASTGYREGGPEPYLQHLEEMLVVRATRDAMFEKAEAATGLERARLLDEAIGSIDTSVVNQFYREVVEEIGTLDADDEAGLRSKYFAAEDKERQAELLARVDLAARGLAAPQALVTVEEVLAEKRLPADVRHEIIQRKIAILRKAGLENDMVLAYDELLAIEGLAPFVYEQDFVAKAYALVAIGREEDAIETLTNRIASTLENRSLLQTRAELFARTDRYEDALKDLAVVASHAQREPDVLVEVAVAQADCLLSLEREDEALAALDQVLARKDLDEELRGDTLIEKAMILRELDRSDEAVTAEDEAVRITTDARRRAQLLQIIETLRK